jgi:50S ribosomal protein L16 3-hydroxylase
LAIGRYRDIFQSRDFGGEGFSDFLGTFLSRYRLAHEPAPPDTFIRPAALIKSLKQGKTLGHNPWTRLLWVESKTGARLFAAGSAWSCTVDCALAICDPERLSRLDHNLPEPVLKLICELLNRGHLYLERL